MEYEIEYTRCSKGFLRVPVCFQNKSRIFFHTLSFSHRVYVCFRHDLVPQKVLLLNLQCLITFLLKAGKFNAFLMSFYLQNAAIHLVTALRSLPMPLLCHYNMLTSMS